MSLFRYYTPRACERCSEQFYPGADNARYCSERCQHAAARLRRRLRNRNMLKLQPPPRHDNLLGEARMTKLATAVASAEFSPTPDKALEALGYGRKSPQDTDRADAYPDEKPEEKKP